MPAFPKAINLVLSKEAAVRLQYQAAEQPLARIDKWLTVPFRCISML